MNDCVHYDEETNKCGIFCIPCGDIPSTMGCYFSIADRDKMLNYVV